MLYEDFNSWKENYCGECKSDEDLFKIFYSKKISSESLNLQDIISNMAYQIFQLQECIEGILEDIGV